MVRVIIEEREPAPLMQPTSLSEELEYRVQTVVVEVRDPRSGEESLLYFGPRGFVAEFVAEVPEQS